MFVRRIVSSLITIVMCSIGYADTTSDCVARYSEETGELHIPCLNYRDENGGLYSKILTINLKKVTLPNLNTFVMELTTVEDSHIQEDDIIPNYSQPSDSINK